MMTPSDSTPCHPFRPAPPAHRPPAELPAPDSGSSCASPLVDSPHRAGWRSTPAGVILAACGLLAACSGAAPGGGEEVRPVRVMTVAATGVGRQAEFAGEIRPRIETPVGFQVAGRIVARPATLGQAVRRGDILATLDATDYRLSAASARAGLDAATVDRDQQRADFRRYQDLQRQGFISLADLERRRSALDAAEARFEQARAQAEVSGNQAGYATLRAPLDGVVTGLDAELGQVVAAGQSVVRVARVGRPDDQEVAIALPESRLAELRGVREVAVRTWAAGAARGRVREISPLADPVSRTYEARITLVDPPPQAALGMSATVVFDLGASGPAVVLPLQALLREGDATFAWLLDRDKMTVSRTPVTIAGVSGNDVVIGSGVGPGHTVVTAGVHLLKDGQRVKPLAAEGAAGAPAPAAREATGPAAPRG